jgi:hypothetical protein
MRSCLFALAIAGPGSIAVILPDRNSFNWSR